MTGQDLKTLREARKLSLREVSRGADISVSTLSDFENGVHTALRPQTLRKLEAFLRDDTTEPPNGPMDTETAAKVAEVLTPAALHRKIPIIGMAAAMEWEPSVQQICELWESNDETIDCALDREGLVALRINGTSMEPDFHNGDIIAVSPGTLPATGNVALVCLRGIGLVIKRWYWRHGIVRLESLNPSGRNFQWTIDEIRRTGIIQWRWKVVATLFHQW